MLFLRVINVKSSRRKNLKSIFQLIRHLNKYKSNNIMIKGPKNLTRPLNLAISLLNLFISFLKKLQV